MLLLMLVNALPYLYTPPALNDQNLEAYREVVRFIQAHRQLGTLRILSFGEVQVEKNRRLLKPGEVQQLDQLPMLMKQVRCGVAWSDDSLVYFEPEHNVIVPHAPGVVYSLDGKNPNTLRGDASLMQPFEPIAGNWYLSRKLVPTGTGVFQTYVPRGLLDASLRKPGTLQPY